MAERSMSFILKVYACALVLMIGIGSVTSKRYEDKSNVEAAIDWASENPVKAAIGVAAGAGGAIVAAPFAVAGLGFTSAGIAAKSLAAWGMSWYGGSVPAAGVFATLQTIGATSTVLGSGAATIATGTAGAVLGVSAVKAVTDSKDRD